MDELGALRQGDPRKVICAALVKAHASMNNAWPAKRLCLGNPGAMSELVNRVRKDAESRKILKMLEKIFKSNHRPFSDPVHCVSPSLPITIRDSLGGITMFREHGIDKRR